MFVKEYINIKTMINIRPYEDTDYPAVERNLREANIFYEVRDSKDNYASMTKIDPEAVLVAEIEEEVVGSIMVSPLGVNLAILWSRVVAEKYRRRGIGTKLVEEMEVRLKRKGVKEIWRFIDVTNHTSLASLHANGYQYNPDHVYFGPWKSLED
jgi:predicted N-acetyltransferase YhbS